MAHEQAHLVADEWVTFPGGELEGKRPKALCPPCRDALNQAALSPSTDVRVTKPLCFQCYRANLERERKFRLAGNLDTGSEARFQFQLPLEPVNQARLGQLKVERAEVRTTASVGVGQYVDKRRRAQIAARHALQAISEGLAARRLSPAMRVNAMDAAIHAAELQLPEAWLPFVISR